MFYEPHKKNHGLPHDPFEAIVAPRPIGWITSISARGEINAGYATHYQLWRLL
jgi:flavin reductase (DIM6/NTAB) family NADH-FMN oxidoreductase RutF